MYVVFLFFAWWIFTHHIDRFWVPMIPVVSLLAGIGAAWSSGMVWRITCGSLIAAAVLFNLGFVTTPLCGFNAYLADLPQAGRRAEQMTGRFDILNRLLPSDCKVLCVGEALVFDARFPLVYNTVFDRSIFQEWFAAEKPGVPAGELSMRPADEIRKKLCEEGITHVLVNWQEIVRYRPSSNYGYTDFVAPHRFLKLVQMRVLSPAKTLAYGDYAKLLESEVEQRREVDVWGPELKIVIDEKPVWKTIQIFKVLR